MKLKSYQCQGCPAKLTRKEQYAGNLCKKCTQKVQRERMKLLSKR